MYLVEDENGVGGADFTEILGTGTWGTVYLAVDCATGQREAVKALDKSAAPKLQDAEKLCAMVCRESQALSLLPPHPNIIKLHKVFF